ncbi:MAG: neutral zinc metallopeptidase [Desertimonas sp.]
MTRIRSTDASQIDDRRGRSSGGGRLGFPFPTGGGAGGLPIPTKAGGGLVGVLIVLAAMFLPRLLAGANEAVSTGDGQPTSSVGTCETELEQILCGATNDVQAYWTEMYPQAFGSAYTPTRTVFFSQYAATGCGQATSQVGPFYCPLDALVYFDLDFLVQLQGQFGATGDLAAQYIVAHEYGHHIQNLNGTSEEVQQVQRTNPGLSNQYSVALELQADCYAGTWVHDADRRGLIDDGEVINEAINAAEAVGDDRIQQRTQGRADPESWTHGSADQRAEWFRLGFETGDPTRCDTFAELR